MGGQTNKRKKKDQVSKNEQIMETSQRVWGVVLTVMKTIEVNIFVTTQATSKHSVRCFSGTVLSLASVIFLWRCVDVYYHNFGPVVIDVRMEMAAVVVRRQ